MFKHHTITLTAECKVFEVKKEKKRKKTGIVFSIGAIHFTNVEESPIQRGYSIFFTLY